MRHPNEQRHNRLIYRLCREHYARAAPLLHGDLLDVGCGEKPYASIFEPYVTSYTGLEHPDTIHGREHVDVWGEATAMPFPDESFDSVVSFSVLEHLEEPGVAVREMYRVLRSGGTVLLQVPFMWGIHEAPRDFFRFTPYGLRHILSDAGFVDIEITAICGYWSTTGIRFAYHMHRLEGGRVPRSLLAFLQLAAQRVGYRLDQWNHEEADSAGYVVVASKAG